MINITRLSLIFLFILTSAFIDYHCQTELLSTSIIIHDLDQSSSWLGISRNCDTNQSCNSNLCLGDFNSCGICIPQDGFHLHDWEIRIHLPSAISTVSWLFLNSSNSSKSSFLPLYGAVDGGREFNWIGNSLIPADCSFYPNSSSCNNRPDCIWNSDNSTCIDNTNFPPPEPYPPCSYYPSTATCTSASSCHWCLETGKCVSDNQCIPVVECQPLDPITSNHSNLATILIIDSLSRGTITVNRNCDDVYYSCSSNPPSCIPEVLNHDCGKCATISTEFSSTFFISFPMDRSTKLYIDTPSSNPATIEVDSESNGLEYIWDSNVINLLPCSLYSTSKDACSNSGRPDCSWCPLNSTCYFSEGQLSCQCYYTPQLCSQSNPVSGKSCTWCEGSSLCLANNSASLTSSLCIDIGSAKAFDIWNYLEDTLGSGGRIGLIIGVVAIFVLCIFYFIISWLRKGDDEKVSPEPETANVSEEREKLVSIKRNLPTPHRKGEKKIKQNHSPFRPRYKKCPFNG